MKKLLIALVLLSAVTFSCNNRDQKDEATNANTIKITVDVVAEDFNGTETTSNSGMASLPKN